MTSTYADPWLTVYGGDCREVLSALPERSVHCVVTSPPYWGLRDYGTAAWEGGDEGCDHAFVPDAGVTSQRVGRTYQQGHPHRECRCGARRLDSQLGLEPTPEQYVENMVAVFRAVRRVLRDDGTVWLNLGDSYATSGTRQGNRGLTLGSERLDEHRRFYTSRPTQLKEKDLVGIPWRVAFALQADGWYLRSDIIWSKPNPMPESVTDRPTKAHEYLFLLSKSPRYYYDADAVREPHTGRNLRSVWSITTEPYPGAHFATFPRKLVEPCVKAGSPIGGIVLDPFAGSGTAGLVAQSLSRRAILIDLNPEYLRQALRRASRQFGVGGPVLEDTGNVEYPEDALWRLG